MDQLDKYENLMIAYQLEVRSALEAKEALQHAHFERLELIEQITFLERENEYLKNKLDMS